MSAVMFLLASVARAGEPLVPVVKAPAAFDWRASASLPPGADYQIVSVDAKTNAITTIVRLPRGYEIPLHSHGSDEVIVVLKGRVELEFSGSKDVVVPGGYAVIPAGIQFVLRTPGIGGAQFVAAFNGPFDVKMAARQ